jgi:CBS domain-containing protein
VQVKEIMKRAVATIGPDASLAVAACKMRNRDVGCLPVVDGERLLGIITDRDIVVRGVAEALDPHRARVREAMSTIAIAGSPDQTVEEAGS